MFSPQGKIVGKWWDCSESLNNGLQICKRIDLEAILLCYFFIVALEN